ncbi:MAG: hypothetical protein AAFR24_02930 [Cyanobacteria bacterium J06627_3]
MINEVLAVIQMRPNLKNLGLNNLRQCLCYLTTASMMLLLSPVPVSAQSEGCGFLVEPQTYNTVEGDGRIVIGRVPDRPYIVLLTHNLQENLPTIRTCIPDAFLTSSRLGSYIHIASLDNYREAKELVNDINQTLDLDVRIIHYRRLGR